MAIPVPQLKNILVFMDRTPCTGKEAIGWVETYQAVQREIFEIEQLNAKLAATPKPDTQHISPEIEA
jgi:hypothetical protein